jgi:transcriptional regulator with XRE-family HTH domain
MDEIGERIKQFIEEMNLNAAEFSELIGIQRSSLSHLYSGRNKPSVDLLLKIKKHFPEANLEWLITGIKSPVNPAKVEIDEKKVENKAKSDVTNVNNDVSKTDNQNITDIHNAKEKAKAKSKEIESVLLIYTDGSFKAYKNDPK